MKNVFKRLFSFLIALVMVLVMVPFNGLEVYAAETTGVTTQTALQTALNAGGDVKLGGNITGAVTVPAGVSAVLDLGGYTLSETMAFGGAANLLVVEGNLTIKNGTISASGMMGNTIRLNGNGSLTIDGATVTNACMMGSTVMVCDNASLTVNSGTISNSCKQSGYYAIYPQDSATVTINGGTVNATNQAAAIGTDVGATKINTAISAGTINGKIDTTMTKNTLVITGGKFTADVSGFVAEGYEYDATTGTVTAPAPQYAVEVNGEGFETFAAALEYAGTVDGVANITLLEDTTFGSGSVKGNVVLDLNGHVLTITAENVFTLSSCKLTVQDSSAEKTGKIDNSAIASDGGNMFLVYDNSELTIESGTIHAKNNMIFTYGSNIKVTINGGELKHFVSTGSVLYPVASDATITVNGGTLLGSIPFNYGTLVVKGGQFTQDVSAYCAYGMTTKLVDGMYQIVEAEKNVFIGDTGYLTLEEALNAAKENDVVEIRAAGSYVLKRGTPNEVGAYYLPKNLTIKGMVDGVVVTNSPAINATNVTIDNVDFISNDRSLVFHTYGESVIKNCDLIAPNGTYYSTVNSGTLLVENCVFEGTATYGLMVGEGAGAVTVKGCTIQGWNSFGNTGLLTIEDSEFVNGAYSKLVAYQDVKVTNTKFDTDYSIVGAAGIVAEFTDCSVGGDDTVDAMKAIIDPELIEVAEDVIINGKSLNASYVAQVGDTQYENLQDALKAAAAGQTVVLLTPYTENGIINVMPGITLDLNGNVLTANNYVLAMFGNSHIIDSTKGEGALKVAQANLFLMKSNEMMSIEMSENEFHFTTVEIQRQNSLAYPSAGAGKYTFRMHAGTTSQYFKDIMTAGNLADKGLSIRVKLSGKNAAGTQRTYYYELSEADLAAYVNGGAFGKMVEITVSGLDTLTDVAFYTEVVSAEGTSAEVIHSCSKVVYNP